MNTATCTYDNKPPHRRAMRSRCNWLLFVGIPLRSVTIWASCCRIGFSPGQRRLFEPPLVACAPQSSVLVLVRCAVVLFSLKPSYRRACLQGVRVLCMLYRISNLLYIYEPREHHVFTYGNIVCIRPTFYTIRVGPDIWIWNENGSG